LQASRTLRLTRSNTLEHAVTDSRMSPPRSVCSMTERAGPVPPWVQVTAALRERILSGELAPGAMVPSIVALHQEYGIAKTTARKVLAALRDEGLIVTTPGWGSFVAERG
jgi:GntR family transcriptional regulator